jgi:predicted NACHT family NTPase
MLEFLAVATGVELGQLVLKQVLDLSKPVLESYVQDFFNCLAGGVARLGMDCLRCGWGGAAQGKSAQATDGRGDRGIHPAISQGAIELRGYSQSQANQECRDFVEFAHKGSNWVSHLDEHQLETWLQDGKVLVMFDGLDEVVDRQQRGTVLTQIHGFTQRYPSVPVIVTSRVIGYSAQTLRDAGFQHFMLQDLEPEQIETFVQSWHDLTYTDGAERDRKRDRLKQAIDRSKAIQELAGNPLLLTLMAILNRGEELPRDRARLYEKASEVLLYQWDVEEKLLKDPRLEKYPIEITYRDKQRMLRRVAAAMQNSAKGLAGNFIRYDDLENCLRDYLSEIKQAPNAPSIAQVIIDQLRYRNFVLCSLGGDAYAFVHRTFLEFFCAAEIKERFDKRGKEGGLTFDQLRDEVLAPHWQDGTWHEVLRLVAGMLEPAFAGDLIEWLMAQPLNPVEHLSGNRLKISGLMNLLLAADCLGEVEDRATLGSKPQHLLAQLKAEAVREYPYRFLEDAARALITAIVTHWPQDPHLAPWLNTCLRLEIESYLPDASVSAISQLGTQNPQTFAQLKALAQDYSSWTVRSAAVQELARGWKDDPETLSILKTRTQSDEDSSVRGDAMRALAQDWKDDPETLPILKTRAQSDEDSSVRSAAVQELARGWKDNPETLSILKSCAHSDENSNVRSAAVQELARGWKDNPETLSILKSCAQSDEDWSVRSTTVRVLAQGWKDDPETLPWLKTCAQSDEDLNVRRAAVQELARGWKDNPETLPWLKTCAQSDEDSNVRSATVQELAWGWKDDPETLPWIKACAQSDKDSNVRSAAVQELARGWKDDPETLPILKTCAQSDEDSNVRSAAIRALTQGWKGDPETLPILKTRAQSDEDSNVRRAAIRALTQGWKGDPETLPWLKTRAQSDEDSNVRSAAVQELARGWKGDPETLPWLKTRAQSDEDSNVRSAAVQGLARGWKGDPETLPWLKTRAQSDEDSNVRSAAVQELARGWKDDPETLPWLKTRAQSDEDSNVHSAAVQELARGWKDDPETLPILKSRAQSDKDSNVRSAAVQELARGWKGDPEMLPILKSRAQDDDNEECIPVLQDSP